MRDRIIEEQLKKRYVKDLIGIMADLGVKHVDEKEGDKHIDLIELIQRRNIHVHNRGVVDERPSGAKSPWITQLAVGGPHCY